MSTEEDGGSAFPVVGQFAANGSVIHPPTPGMSLRDWFAGQIAQGIAANPTTKASPPVTLLEALDYIAEISYKFADAMMKTRKL